ncbi:MAG: hypothetical protein IJI53_11065 [Clostridia bacterium]|nr:hypothetical protein [Clostridia bacterium]
MEMDELAELKTLLMNVPKSYDFFYNGLYNDARYDRRLIKPISAFIKNNPNADGSDVLEYCLDLFDELGIENKE